LVEDAPREMFLLALVVLQKSKVFGHWFKGEAPSHRPDMKGKQGKESGVGAQINHDWVGRNLFKKKPGSVCPV